MKNLLLSAGLLAASLAAPAAQPTPRQLYPGLFEAVQMRRVYPDGKTFVGCPTHRPARRNRSRLRAAAHPAGLRPQSICSAVLHAARGSY
ncbi:MAG: hypothetical protein WKG07_34870 [Hymenobacter sp.]